ncbi:MAG TPA: hypothetical protein VNJ29_00765 [Candidatus Nitrosotenuis sp.]|nr:hypothetical protein [Candidatus Nitrosotenuis sp.]
MGTHEKYDWINSLIKPNISCCFHHLSQSGRYIISRAPNYQLNFSIYDLQKLKILISSEYKREFEQWDVYDSRMKDVLPYDMYNGFSDIAVSPDDEHVVFSDEDWAVVMKLQDYTKVREYGEYRENIHLKSKKPKPSPNNNYEKPNKICIQTCGFCGGLGYNERASEDCCSQCGGKGYTGSKWISNSRGGEWLNTTCWKCNGTGGCKQSTSREYCKYCNHTGCYKYE